MRWHHEEMAAFCSFFPWCSPQLFWDLSAAEYESLSDVIRRTAKERSHG